MRGNPVIGRLTGVAVAVTLLVGCERAAALDELPAGSLVTIETDDGRVVSGTLDAITVDGVVIDPDQYGNRQEVPRAVVRRIRGASPDGVGTRTVAADLAIVVPAGTVVPVILETTLSSTASQVDDPVRGHARDAIVVDGEVAIRAGSAVRGHVTRVESTSGSSDGQASLAFLFTEIHVHDQVLAVVTDPFVYRTAGSEADDAAIDGIEDAAPGMTNTAAATGSGADSALVMVLMDDDVTVPSGTVLPMHLLEPVTTRTTTTRRRE